MNPRFRLINPHHANGRYWHCEEENLSVFEDTQEPESRYYSWSGDWEAHDTAPHMPLKPEISEILSREKVER